MSELDDNFLIDVLFSNFMISTSFYSFFFQVWLEVFCRILSFLFRSVLIKYSVFKREKKFPHVYIYRCEVHHHRNRQVSQTQDYMIIVIYFETMLFKWVWREKWWKIKKKKDVLRIHIENISSSSSSSSGFKNYSAILFYIHI